MAAAATRIEVQDNGPFTCFFYGTLIHPGVLSRIIGSSGSYLQVQQAILPHHSVHRVKEAEYPGLVAAPQGGDVSELVRVARGVLVQGLTLKDVARLDAFEGEEYGRIQVQCITVGDAVPNDRRSEGRAEELLSELTTQQTQDMLQFQAQAQDTTQQQQHSKFQVQTAQTYVWTAPSSRLQHADALKAEDQSWRWEFENFAKLQAHRWVTGERN